MTLYAQIVPSSSVSDINPIAIPATGLINLTPAAISDIVDPHTDPIDVDPPEPIHSDTTLITYGDVSASGIMYSSAFSANLP